VIDGHRHFSRLSQPGAEPVCIRNGLLRLFAGFIATMPGADFSGPCIIGYGSSPSRCGPATAAPLWSDPRPPSLRPGILEFWQIGPFYILILNLEDANFRLAAALPEFDVVDDRLK
jgi:hypothetical protein